VVAFIPLLLALPMVHWYRTEPIPAGATPWAAALLGLGLWYAVSEILGRVIARRAERRWLSRWEILAQGLILGLFFWLCRDQGWAAWAGSWTVGLAPWLLCQAIVWSTSARAINAIAGRQWSRLGLVLHHLRFELAPMLIVLPILDLCEVVGERLGTLAWFNGPEGLLLSLIGGWLLVIGLLAVLPAGLALLWGAKPLPDGPLARQLAEDNLRQGLGDVRLRVWNSPGGQVHNAMAMGLFPGLRWILVSADLITDLPPEQVRAVVAHEAGHHRHRHLLTYLGFALVANLASFALLRALVGTADAQGRPLPFFGEGLSGDPGLLFRIPGVDLLPAEAVLIAASAGTVLLAWRLLFGVLSRACERQADLAGARTISPQAMAGALQTVAQLSGTPEDAPSWRHHPIRERVRFLLAATSQPALVPLHHRIVRDMRLVLIASFALLIAMGAGMYFDPRRESLTVQDPAAHISAWTKRDSGLGEALLQADQGNAGSLIQWLNRAPVQDRQSLAILHIRLAELSGGVGSDGRVLPPNDRVPWTMRHRLAALSVCSLEDSDGRLTLSVDNLLAYGLVAGTTAPTGPELDLAKSRLPALQAAFAKLPDHGLLDTIACVHFALRDWDAARRAWEQCLTLAAKDDDGPSAERLAHEALYRRRLEDAQHNLAVSAGSRPGPLRPLHLTFQP
jgi:Zn-dependent protease with chaperone function